MDTNLAPSVEAATILLDMLTAAAIVSDADATKILMALQLEGRAMVKLSWGETGPLYMVLIDP